MKTQSTVYVVDDDAAMRESTCMVLEAAGISAEAFGSAEGFLQSEPAGRAGCLILDLQMPGMGGMELLQKLTAEGITLPVLVVSGTGTIPVAVQGMKLGVEDFLEKPVHPDILVTKVREALKVDAKLREERAKIEPVRQRLATLTERERDLLQHIVKGMPNKLIARAMGISIKTVENHRASLMRKAEASNTADLVRMHMLISLPASPN